MRILHLSSLYPPQAIGGAERSVALLAERTAALGRQVGVACIARRPEPPTERNGVTVFRMPHENAFWLEDWPQQSPAARDRSKFAQQFNVRIAARFGAVLDQFRPDLVHTHSLVEISTLVWRAARARGLPIVHTLRDYDLVCGNSAMLRDGRPCRGPHVKCRAMTLTKRLNQRLVDAVVGVSHDILERHLALGFFRTLRPEHRRVIWNPVEAPPPDSERGGRRGDFVFGYLGRLSPEKGVATLLEAARRLPLGGWRLLVAGSALDGAGDLRAKAAGLPVEFAGFVEPNAFFRRIDLLVVPSLWPEPLPRVVLEACAAGVPALGARTGGIPELIGPERDERLFPPGDAAALAERLLAALCAGREAPPPTADFRRVLDRTRPDRVARAYLALYDHLLAA